MTKWEADNLQQQCMMLNKHIQPFQIDCDVREWGYSEGEHIWEVALKFSRLQAETHHFTDCQMARGCVQGMQYAFGEVKTYNWTKGALSMTKKIGESAGIDNNHAPSEEHNPSFEESAGIEDNHAPYEEHDPSFGKCGRCGSWVTFPCYNCQAMLLEDE